MEQVLNGSISIGYEDIVCEEELSNMLSLSVQQIGSGSAIHFYSLIHNISSLIIAQPFLCLF